MFVKNLSPSPSVLTSVDLLHIRTNQYHVEMSNTLGLRTQPRRRTSGRPEICRRLHVAESYCRGCILASFAWLQQPRHEDRRPAVPSPPTQCQLTRAVLALQRSDNGALDRVSHLKQQYIRHYVAVKLTAHAGLRCDPEKARIDGTSKLLSTLTAQFCDILRTSIGFERPAPPAARPSGLVLNLVGSELRLEASTRLQVNHTTF